MHLVTLGEQFRNIEFLRGLFIISNVSKGRKFFDYISMKENLTTFLIMCSSFSSGSFFLNLDCLSKDYSNK